MLPPPLFHGKEADISIMTYCNSTAYWLLHDAMPKIVDAPLTLIFRMWQRACHLHFSQSRWPLHLLWKDVTMQPIDCWMCKTQNHWHSVDPHINHIETASVHSVIVWNQSYTQYGPPLLCLYVLSFASRSFVTSQFLINCYLRYLGEKSRGPIAFPRFRLAIDGMWFVSLVLENIARLSHDSLSSSFTSLSMTYHMQFQISQPCAPGLCGELCSWLHGWM